MININMRNKGFTLIELLIAISILSLLLFTGSYSYSLMSERWNKELGQFEQSAKTAKHLELVQRLLEGIHPFVVVDKNNKPSFFFIGDEDSLLTVSRAGVFSGEFPEIFRLSTVHKENGLVDLIYQSNSTEQILLTGTDQSIIFNKQMVLFNDLDSVSFHYLGWSHYFEKNADKEDNNTNVSQAKWFNRFSGIDNQLMPEQLTLVLVKSDKLLHIPVYLEVDSESWLSPYMEDKE